MSGAPLHVVVAPDSFKGTVTAVGAARALAEGWTSVRPGDRIELLPQADGGEGTLDTIAAAVPGSVRHRIGSVTGPDGQPVEGLWLRLPDGTAVVELAISSGLPLMTRPDAMRATTRGLGETLHAVLDAGVDSVVIAIGGSASTDGGTGALAALGARFLAADGHPLPDGGGDLARLTRVDVAALRPAPPEVRVLVDVSSPLLGAEGAAAVYGPQKGATPDDVRLLDAGLAALASVIGGDPDLPGSGAAGGTAFGLHRLWNARLAPGAREIAALTGLTSRIGVADVVLSGEGRFDGQSTRGKVVGELLAATRGSRTQVGVVAGILATSPGVPAWSLADLAGSAEAATSDATHWLRTAGARAAHTLPV